ncbi:uncharacterized protein LOC115731661 isoform X2 [Rhodamnia argentea]|nr:uncharacterized protein LOC115731661 isoform X2 [Rhodamnia argentea]
MSQEGERRDPGVAERAAEYSGARTLQRCRDVHIRIKALRENWDALRHGSLSFHSGNVESVHGQSKEQDHNNSGHDRLAQPSSSHQPSEDEDSVLGFAPNNKDKYGITKAWKMMDRAKSRRQARDLTGSFRPRSPVINRQRQKRCPGLPPSTMDQAGLQRHGYDPNKSVGTLHSITYQEDICPSVTSAAGSVSGSSNSSPATLAASIASSQNSQGKGVLEEAHVAGHSRRGDGAKSEIQSLVKFNLKLLSCNKRLGVDAFKEIARAATHTILAACGLERPKSVIPRSVCRHTDDIRRLHKSTLMPNSCRECFYVYVKTVVDTLLLEKLSEAN